MVAFNSRHLQATLKFTRLKLDSTRAWLKMLTSRVKLAQTRTPLASFTLLIYIVYECLPFEAMVSTLQVPLVLRRKDHPRQM